MDFLHDLNIQRLKTVASGSNEVEAGVDTGVSNPPAGAFQSMLILCSPIPAAGLHSAYQCLLMKIAGVLGSDIFPAHGSSS